MQSKQFVFTVWDCHLDPHEIAEILEPYDFCYFSLEECPSTARSHYQGFVIFPRRRRQTALCKLFPTHPFMEAMHGSFKHNTTYCSKSPSHVDGPYIFGEEPIAKRPGKRNDIHSYVADVMENMSPRDLLVKHPGCFLRYGVDKILSTCAPVRTEAPIVEVFYGPTGAGKSRRAREENPGIWVMPIRCNRNLWFQRYHGQRAALIDDFKGSISLEALLNLLDRYEQVVEIKGADVLWNPDKIIITSNFHPYLWYNWDGRELQYEALRRRCTLIEFMDYVSPQVGPARSLQGGSPALGTPPSVDYAQEGSRISCNPEDSMYDYE